MLPCFFNSQVKKAFSEKTGYNASANAEWQFDAYLYAVLKNRKNIFLLLTTLTLCVILILFTLFK